MKFQLTPEASALENSNKLPKEDAVRNYMDQFMIADPYSSKHFPTLEQVCLTIKKYDVDSPVRLNDACMASSFRHPNIVPAWDFIGSTRDLSISPMIVDNWPGWFVSALKQHDSAFVKTHRISITRGSQASEVNHQLKRWVDSTLSTQSGRIVSALKEKGYVEVRSEPKLHEEVLRRRAQFPGERIYVLVGDEMSDYFHNIHKSHRWHDTYLLNTHHCGYYNNSGIGRYASAVFTTQQIRTAHRYFIHYGIEKQPRRWRIEYAAACQFTMEMDECIQEEKVLKKKSLGRFGMIM